MKYENVNPNAIPPLSYSVESFTDSKIRIVLDSIYFYQDSSSDSSYYYGGYGQQTYGHNILLDNYIKNNFPERTRALNIHLTGSEWPCVGGYSGAINTGAFTEMFGADIEVQPNPASDWTTFNFNLPGKETVGYIKIFDVSGKLIESFTVSSNQSQKIWDTRNIDSGVYFYMLKSDEIQITGKFIIQH